MAVASQAPHTPPPYPGSLGLFFYSWPQETLAASCCSGKVQSAWDLNNSHALFSTVTPVTVGSVCQGYPNREEGAPRMLHLHAQSHRRYLLQVMQVVRQRREVRNPGVKRLSLLL